MPPPAAIRIKNIKRIVNKSNLPPFFGLSGDNGCWGDWGWDDCGAGFCTVDSEGSGGAGGVAVKGG